MTGSTSGCSAFPAATNSKAARWSSPQWTRTWYAAHGRPWVYARQSEQLTIGPRSIDVDGVSFTSDRLRRMLVQADAHGVVLVAVSAGPEIEREAHRCWLEERPDEYFFLEMFGSAVVEHLTTMTGARLCAWADARRHGDAAALQSGVSRVGHRGSAGALLAHRRRRDPGHARRDGFRHADAEEIAARRLRRHAAYRTCAALERARALRELLVRDLPVPARAVRPRRSRWAGARAGGRRTRRTRCYTLGTTTRSGDGRPSVCRSQQPATGPSTHSSGTMERRAATWAGRSRFTIG